MSSCYSSQFTRHSGKGSDETDMWLAFCLFHLGDYKQAMEEYEKLSRKDTCNPDVWVNLACCYFFLGMYPQADEACKKGE